MSNQSKIINWSEVGRILTNDRTAIRSDYSGKKYKRKVARINKIANLLTRFLSAKD